MRLDQAKLYDSAKMIYLLILQEDIIYVVTLYPYNSFDGLILKYCKIKMMQIKNNSPPN